MTAGEVDLAEYTRSIERLNTSLGFLQTEMQRLAQQQEKIMAMRDQQQQAWVIPPPAPSPHRYPVTARFIDEATEMQAPHYCFYFFSTQAAPRVAQQQRDRQRIGPGVGGILVPDPVLFWVATRPQPFTCGHQTTTGLVSCQNASDSPSKRPEGHPHQSDAQPSHLSRQPAQTETLQLQPNPAELVCLPESRRGRQGKTQPRAQGRKR